LEANPQHRGGAPYRDRATADRFGGAARGDSLANRQAGARHSLAVKAAIWQAIGPGDGRLGNQAGGGLGAGNGLSGGGQNSIGGRDLTAGAGAGNRDAFGGGSRGSRDTTDPARARTAAAVPLQHGIPKWRLPRRRWRGGGGGGGKRRSL